MQYSRGGRSKRRSRFAASKTRKPYGSNRNGSDGSSRKKIGILFLIGLFFLGVWQLPSLFGSMWTKDASAQIFIERGKAEFSLEGSSSWTRAIAEQKFLPGDELRTGNNTVASLQFFDGYEIFLSENTEIEIKKLSVSSKETKDIVFVLNQGQIWVHVPEDKQLKEGDSSFLIETSRGNVAAKGTIFDIVTTDNEDVISLVRGAVDVSIFTDEKKKKTKTVSVGVGQKLVLNTKNIESIVDGSDVLEMTDNNFLESDWHLAHLEKFSPEEAAQVRRKLEIAATAQRKATQTAAGEEDLPKADVETPTITSPTSDTVVPANQDSVKLEGTVPAEAFQVSVNGYTLTKFNPGDRKWTYFASKKFGTLVTGENTYEVVAITRDGKKSDPATIKLTYEGINTGVSAKNTTQEPTFPSPVIIKPALVSLDEIYQTSSEVVTILGTVSLGTQWVTVNDFRLRKFAPGNTEFSYIANARYGNMKRGLNLYRVSAFGPSGAQSTVTVKVHYQPLDL
jgi:hypothetical protein